MRVARKIKVRAEPPKVRVVRKGDAKANAVVQPDALEHCLECWKAWMVYSADRDMGVKTLRCLVGEGGSYEPDVYERQRLADSRIAEATDAMIDSLKLIHMWAIYKSCSIPTSWNFPNADFLVVAEQAREELHKKLKNNSCTSILF